MFQTPSGRTGQGRECHNRIGLAQVNVFVHTICAMWGGMGVLFIQVAQESRLRRLLPSTGFHDQCEDPPIVNQAPPLKGTAQK